MDAVEAEARRAGRALHLLGQEASVRGWTTHHSILPIKGKWYIFYHDTQLSGKTWLRNIKVTELKRKADGGIETIVP